MTARPAGDPPVEIAESNAARGIAFKVLSVVVFTGMALIIKATAAAVPAGEAVFFRAFFGIPVIVLWRYARGDFPAGIRTANPMGHFWRGLVGVTSMGLGFAALGLLPYSDAVAIGYAAPLLVTIFGAMFLGERLRIFRLSAVFIGLVGVVIILYPNMVLLRQETVTPVQTVGALLALMAAVFAAIAQVFVRQLVRHEGTAAIVFWFHVSAAGLTLVTLPFGWAVPALDVFALLVLAGLLGGIGQLLLTESYRHAETGVIAPFEYTSILLAIAAGYLFFGETPADDVLWGAVFIVGAGLFILYRERRLGIERARSRKVMTPQG